MNKTLNVLLAVHHFPPRRIGGAELRAHRNAHDLVRRGHRVQVVCVEAIDHPSQDGSLTWSDEVYEGIPVRRLIFDLAGMPDPLRWSFDNPLLESHFTDLMTAGHFDLLHLFSGYLMGVAPMRAARRLGVPIVVDLTDFWFLCPTIQLLRGDGSLCPGPEPIECARCLFDQKRRFRILDQRFPQLMRRFWRLASERPALGKWFGLPERLSALEERRAVLRDALNSADAVKSITRFAANMHAANGVDAARIVVIPDCVDIGANNGESRSVDRPVLTRFGYLGQIAPIKGVDVLIRAFRRLDRTRRRAQLTIHGGLNVRPEYSRQLRRLAGGDGDIVFAGEYAHGQVMSKLRELDVIIVPSLWYENSPSVILEAFAARCPVIGTNVGGIAEVVRQDVNGLLFQRGDASDLARQMQRVLDAPGLVERLRQGIPPMRPVEEDVLALEGVYRSILKKHPDAAAVGAVE